MQIRSSIHEQKATLSLSGRFDFTLHKEFRDTYEQVLTNASVREIEIDLRDVEYLDSSALGMLLLLKDRASQNSARVSLSHCRDTVRQILEIANFHKLFPVN